MHRPCLRRAGQRGVSLVELMVGLAAGMAVLAGAIALAGSQFANQRQLLREARLQQDLRAAADIVVRDLRRAGAWTNAEQALPRPPAPAQANPFAALTLAGDAPEGVRHTWDRGPGLASAFGFRLAGATLQILVGTTWQALTDPRALHVTAFTVTPLARPAAVVPCPRACPDGGQACWPRVTARLLAVEIAGHPPSSPALQRRLATVVHLRNDLVEGRCP